MFSLRDGHVNCHNIAHYAHGPRFLANKRRKLVQTPDLTIDLSPKANTLQAIFMSIGEHAAPKALALRRRIVNLLTAILRVTQWSAALAWVATSTVNILGEQTAQACTNGCWRQSTKPR